MRPCFRSRRRERRHVAPRPERAQRDGAATTSRLEATSTVPRRGSGVGRPRARCQPKVEMSGPAQSRDVGLHGNASRNDLLQGAGQRAGVSSELLPGKSGHPTKTPVGLARRGSVGPSMRIAVTCPLAFRAETRRCAPNRHRTPPHSPQSDRNLNERFWAQSKRKPAPSPALAVSGHTVNTFVPPRVTEWRVSTAAPSA